MTSTTDIILGLLNIAVNVFFIYRLLKMDQNLKIIAAQIDSPKATMKASLADVIQNVEPTETPYTGTFTATDTKVGN